jgi:proteic killer suppression protein
VVRSFASRETEEIWQTGKTRGSPPADVTKRKLAMLDAALELHDLRYPPGNRIEKLAATGKGNTAFASTTNIGSVLFGAITTLTTCK